VELHKTCYTYNRRPVELVYLTEFKDVYDAIAWEKQLKGWSRKKKQAIIENKFEKLPDLSKRQTDYNKKCSCHPEEPKGRLEG